MIEAIAQPIVLGTATAHVSASIGISTFDRGMSAEECLGGGQTLRCTRLSAPDVIARSGLTTRWSASCSSAQGSKTRFGMRSLLANSCLIPAPDGPRHG